MCQICDEIVPKTRGSRGVAGELGSAESCRHTPAACEPPDRARQPGQGCGRRARLSRVVRTCPAPRGARTCQVEPGSRAGGGVAGDLGGSESYGHTPRGDCAREAVTARATSCHCRLTLRPALDVL